MSFPFLRRPLVFWAVLFSCLIALDRTVSYLFLDEIADLRDLDKNGRLAKEIVFVGSSTMFYSVDRERLSSVFGDRWTLLGIPNGTPLEFSTIYGKYLEGKEKVFFFLTEFDLNDNNVSSSMTSIVPFRDVIRLLFSTDVHWEVDKKLLSEYALYYLRWFLHASGRGNELTVAIRDAIVKRLPGGLKREAAVSLRPTGINLEDQAISNFGEDRLARIIAKERYSGINPHIFQGYKLQSLKETLEQISKSNTRGYVVFLPVSPLYEKKIRVLAKNENFENTTQNLKRSFPRIRFIDLSHAARLDNDSLYFDSVHLNGRGRVLATQSLLRDLSK